MALSAKWKSVLLRAAKGLGALALGFLAKWLVSPEVLNLVGTQNQWIVVAIVVPGILALEKYLKWTPAPPAAK